MTRIEQTTLDETTRIEQTTMKETSIEQTTLEEPASIEQTTLEEMTTVKQTPFTKITSIEQRLVTLAETSVALHTASLASIQMATTTNSETDSNASAITTTTTPCNTTENSQHLIATKTPLQPITQLHMTKTDSTTELLKVDHTNQTTSAQNDSSINVPTTMYPSQGSPVLAWNMWGGWSVCTTSCGGGSQVRMKLCMGASITECARHVVGGTVKLLSKCIVAC